MKQNVSETESNSRFQKKKSVSKQESVFDAAFKAWPFSSDHNFAIKDDRVTGVTYKYCPLVVSPTVTNYGKGLHLKYSRIP